MTPAKQHTTLYRTLLCLLPGLIVYLALALPGVRYGLPDNTHLFPYYPDETLWVLAKNRMAMSPERLPNPDIIQPTFYLWTYMGAVRLARSLGWYNPPHLAPGQLLSRYMLAQIYLPGRYLQIVFGCLLLATMALITMTLYDEKATVLASLLLGLCPGLIGVSHFSHTNLPVTTMSFLSLALLLADQRKNAPRPTLLRAAAFVGGLACATKYSAFPLLVPLLYRSWMRERKIPFSLGIMAWAAFGFGIGCPFSWLTPHTFLEGFFSLAAWVKIPVPGVMNAILFPLRYSFPYSLGPVLAIFSLVAVVWAIVYRDSEDTLLLLWLGVFVIGVYRSGAIASPGRMVIAAPVLILLVSRMLSSLYDTRKNYRLGIMAAALLVLCSTLLISLTVVRLHAARPIQKQASDWIWDHVRPGTPFGVLEPAYHWTPDILYPDSPDLPGFKPLYPLVVTGGSIEKARPLEYLLMTYQQRAEASPEFLSWLDSNQDFTVGHRFMRDLSWGPFVWHRQECPFGMTEDDLSVYSLILYQKIHPSRGS